jgi:flagellar biosynthetic protein FlhB
LQTFEAIFRLSLDAMHQPEALLGVLVASVGLASAVTLPVLLAGMLSAGVATFLQVGPLATLTPISPDLARLSPLRGTQQLFSSKRLIDLAKALGLLAMIAGISWWTLRGSLRGVLSLTLADGTRLLMSLAAVAQQLFLRVGVALLGLGVVDLVYQRWQFQQDQRMTKDEVKREHKNAEGDAHLKHERKRVHQEILEHQVLEQVRGADALIVNPTHLAIAIHYDAEGEGAPEVRAKGADHLAKRMIAAAREAGVPVLRDVPLARSLYELDLGEEVPESLYDAVAAVLHAAWQEREGYEAPSEDEGRP